MKRLKLLAPVRYIPDENGMYPDNIAAILVSVGVAEYEKSKRKKENTSYKYENLEKR
jgi:hypothetical protein